MLGYRQHYNKAILPFEPSGLRDIELWFQMSPYDFFHVRHDCTDGYRHMTRRLVDSKTRLQDERSPSECMSRLNGRHRRDLLRLWMRWEERQGKVLDEGELAELVRELAPLCHRYNNVIILDDEYEMTFEDIKDFSKRKLRIRSTRDKGMDYYRPELLPVYEKRLTENRKRLDDMKRRLIEGLDCDRPEIVARLSPRVVDLMRQVKSDGRHVEELREAIRYLEG